MKSSKPARHNSKTRPGQHKNNNQLRIIGGDWRGRKLPFADIDGLRPTGDRLRETLFNWLAPMIAGAHCLDLYAGSGALGLEALSRGAASCILLDREASVVRQLQQNLITLKSNKGHALQADANQWLAQHDPQEQGFDLVFIDPPFQQQLWQQTLELLQRPGLLQPGAAIYIESPRDQPLVIPADWQLHREKTSGQVCVHLYYFQSTATE